MMIFYCNCVVPGMPVCWYAGMPGMPGMPVWQCAIINN
tara:strand:- start:1 stop:114 length:114 start_codon:yes stop_codon:yes gene_type:complete